MAAKPRILVVDDEPVVRESLRDWFTQDGYPVDIAASAREALQKLEESTWDILVTDIKMPGMDGLELQSKVKEIDPDIAIIIMTAYASLDTAVQAIKEGAYDYVTKPLDPENLEQIVNRAAERQQLMRENIELRERIEAAGAQADAIIGESPEMQRVRAQVEEVAATDACVLVTGETGSGKKLVAHAIHGSSLRRHMPLVAIQLAGLADDAIESDLFGHEPGAFASAPYRRKGRLELASGGTAYFEEIGGLAPKVQAALVRMLEEKTVLRLGGSEPLPVDLRLVAGSSRDLAHATERGDFDRDLFERIRACHIALPPLRQRQSDVPLLASYFLEKAARDAGGRALRLSTAAMRLLTDYAWPGNVGELQNVIERAAVLQPGDEIQASDLPLGPAAKARPSGLALAEAEKQHIRSVLVQVAGDISKAADALEIDEATLKEKLRQHGLETEQE